MQMTDHALHLGRVVDYYARPTSYSSGGSSVSRRDWGLHLAEYCDEFVFADARGGLSTPEHEEANIERIEVRHLGRHRPTMVPMGITDMLADTDLVILHEGWTPSNAYLARECHRRAIPYIAMAQGVYDPNIDQRLKAFRLRVPAERRVLEHALAVHVYFDSEKEYVTRLAPTSRFIVAPTGFEAPDDGPQWTAPGDYYAWFGRYDPQFKGLDLMIDAWHAMAAERRPQLRMCGPDYYGGKEQLRRLVIQRGLEPWISLEDERSGDELWRFITGSRAVLHPARWESLGRSILESTVRGVPVILSTTTELAKDMGEEQTAIFVEPTMRGLLYGLDDAADDALLMRVSAAGRAYTERRFNWSRSMASYTAQLNNLLNP
jgi:glycosyltransferase involved in cell wall biosynthesis